MTPPPSAAMPASAAGDDDDRTQHSSCPGLGLRALAPPATTTGTPNVGMSVKSGLAIGGSIILGENVSACALSHGRP